jgi:hypothetical protein
LLDERPPLQAAWHMSSVEVAIFIALVTFVVALLA